MVVPVEIDHALARWEVFMENLVLRLVLGCVLLMVIAYGYYVGKSYANYPISGQEDDGSPTLEGADKVVGVYSVKEDGRQCGYLYGNKEKSGSMEVLGYSTPRNGEYFLMKSPKTVGFKGVSLEDTGNLYNAADLRRALENRGAYLVSDTLYLVDKEHTEQWALR